MLEKVGSILRIRDRRIQIALGVVTLAGIGLAMYPLVVTVLCSRRYDAACAALERYDYEQADTHLQSYLSLRPTDPAALMKAAQTARRRGDFVEARRRLLLAEQQGAPVTALQREGELLSVQAGDPGRVARLLRLCDEHPQEAETALALEALILGSMKTGDRDVAKHSIELWLKNLPGDMDQAHGLYLRGRTNLVFHQDFPRPLDDFRKAVELAPEHYQARSWLMAGLIGEDPRQAVPHLEWLSRRRPDDPNVRFQAARLQRNLGRPEEAGRLLDEMLAAGPEKKLPLLVERGRVEMDLKHPQEALTWLLQAQSLAPGEREVNLALGDCLRLSGRIDEAKRYQDKVVEIDANNEKMRIAAQQAKGGG